MNDSDLTERIARDEDIYTITASHIFNVLPENVTPAMRRMAKTVNFGIIYGITNKVKGKEAMR